MPRIANTERQCSSQVRCRLQTKVILILACLPGGSGFVAHHVVETILDTTNWNVVSLDRLDLSGRINRLEEMLAEKDDKIKERVRVIYGDLRADINEQLAKDIGSIQVKH